MKTTVEQLVEKFEAWSNEPKDDRLSKEVVADLIREALAAKEIGELVEPEPAKVEPTERLWTCHVDDDSASVYEELPGNRSDVILYARKRDYCAEKWARLCADFHLIVAAVNAYKPKAKPEPIDLTKGTIQIPESLNLTETIGWQEAKHRLDDLERKQRVDRDRIAALEKRLAKLEAKADAPAPEPVKDLVPTRPWRIENVGQFRRLVCRDGVFICQWNAGYNYSEALYQFIVAAVNAYKAEAKPEPEKPQSLTQDPDGWQPLTMENHPPLGDWKIYELKGGLNCFWFFTDKEELEKAIRYGATHWRVPKTDEAKGHPCI